MTILAAILFVLLVCVSAYASNLEDQAGSLQRRLNDRADDVDDWTERYRIQHDEIARLERALRDTHTRLRVSAQALGHMYGDRPDDANALLAEHT